MNTHHHKSPLFERGLGGFSDTNINILTNLPQKMQEKKSHHQSLITNHQKGFSIVELLIAMGIAAIVITTAVGTVGQIYLSQKKILISQDFYAETRFLLERIVQIARNNTIDYDRYFIEIGPDSTTCTGFEDDQIPVIPDTTNPGDFVKVLTDTLENNKDSRSILGYPNIFYWDTNNDDNNKPDRNLGGASSVNTGGDLVADPCAQAFYGDITTLFMINNSRNLQTAVKRTKDDGTSCVNTDNSKCSIFIQRRLGADTTNDGSIDTWTAFTRWDEDNLTCELLNADGANLTDNETPANNLSALGVNDEDPCLQAHDWTAISPPSIKIEELSFLPAPDRDPYLNFRVDTAQTHPHIFMFMKTKLRRDILHPFTLTFDEGKEPTITLQTSASSRVFGDPRRNAPLGGKAKEEPGGVPVAPAPEDGDNTPFAFNFTDVTNAELGSLIY